MGFAMGWEILWPLVPGFTLSAVVQAVVSHREMARRLTDDGHARLLSRSGRPWSFGGSQTRRAARGAVLSTAASGIPNLRHGRVRCRVGRMSHGLAVQREFGYISGYRNGELAVNNSAQKRAIEKYRSRLTKRGIVRFEIQALERDRDLIRALARKLTEEGQKAGQLRRAVQQAVVGGASSTGGILA